jgi:hypothetical protein
VVQTAEGLPIYHEVFAGNTAETTTLVPTIQRVLSRFPIRRVIVVADRGLLSLDNLGELQQICIGDYPLEFILAVPGRRYAEFTELLQDFHTQQCATVFRLALIKELRSGLFEVVHSMVSRAVGEVTYSDNSAGRFRQS